MALKKLTAAPQELHLFGVEPTSLPSVSQYPKAFSRDGLNVWREVLEHPDYLKRGEGLRKDLAPKQMWRHAVHMFLKRCAEQDIYAFDGKTNHEEAAREFLIMARRTLVGYVTRSKVFDVFKIHTIERSYDFTVNGFTISVTVNLRPISDPTVHEWLVGKPDPGFEKHADGVFRRAVHSSIDLEFRPTKNGGKLTYVIRCHTPARLTKGLPNKQRLSQHVESLWMQICSENRLSSTGSRAYF